MLCQIVDTAESMVRRKGDPKGAVAKVRVLIVEDDLLIALCLEEMLTALGFRDIHSARDLPTARRLLDEAAPDFAILDVNLGRETVFPFAAELVARCVPFLFSTGNCRSSFPPEWQDRQIVPKPVQAGSLAAAIRAVGIAGDFGAAAPALS